MKFKTGDEVYLCGPSNIDSPGDHGFVGTVEDTDYGNDGATYLVVTKSRPYGLWYPASSVVASKDTPTHTAGGTCAKFKTGDIVEALEATPGITEGKFYTLAGAGEYSVYFYDDESDYRVRLADSYRRVGSTFAVPTPGDTVAYRARQYGLTEGEYRVFADPRPEIAVPTDTTTPGDAVFRPAHYARYVIEPITFIEANNLPYSVGNVIKYVCRYDAKNGIEDLKKARRYCDILIEKLERGERIAAGEDPHEVWKETL